MDNIYGEYDAGGNLIGVYRNSGELVPFDATDTDLENCCCEGVPLNTCNDCDPAIPDHLCITYPGDLTGDFAAYAGNTYSAINLAGDSEECLWQCRWRERWLDKVAVYYDTEWRVDLYDGANTITWVNSSAALCAPEDGAYTNATYGDVTVALSGCADTYPLECPYDTLAEQPDTLQIVGYQDGDIPVSNCAYCASGFGDTWDGTFPKTSTCNWFMNANPVYNIDGKRFYGALIRWVTSCHWQLRVRCDDGTFNGQVAWYGTLEHSATPEGVYVYNDIYADEWNACTDAPSSLTVEIAS